MTDPATTLTALSDIIAQSASWTRPEQLAAFASVTLILNDLEEYTRTNTVHDKCDAIEKLGAIHSHIRAAYGLDTTQGHSIDQQFAWCRQGVSSIRAGILGQE